MKTIASDKEHLRHCIPFASQSKKNSAEATEIIRSALREGTMTHKAYYKCFQRFCNGDFGLFDQERPGQPKKFENEELEQLLEKNPTQTKEKLAHALGITQQAIFYRLNCSFYVILLNRIKKAPN